MLLTVNLFPVFISAQFSDPVPAITLEGTYGSAVNWVDIDGDGDLDLTISGYYLLPSSARGKLYINDGSTIGFKRDIRLLSKGDQSWSDFDNDGFPELLYAGTLGGSPPSPTAGIDKFGHADPFNYAALSSGFTPVSSASVDWGDFDNDGDYDALISGQDAAGNIFTRIYRNTNAVFTDINAGLPGVIDGKVVFIDYDLDQDLDIFICGKDVNTNKYTRLWKNNGGMFTITNDIFINLRYSQVDWRDFNNDGYPDLLLGGLDDPVRRGLIYINNSGNSFTQSTVTVPGSYQGSSGFGDVDNDGLLDVFISGVKDISNDRFVFINDRAGSLIPSAFVSSPVSLSFFQFGDWNKDDKLDFVVNGYMQGTGPGLTVIENNTTSTANTKPSAPLNPTAIVSGTRVLLKWDHSVDNNTPTKALTYNIYMGTAIHGANVVSPNADVLTGFRRISKPGYIQDTAWTIKNLPVGIYHWGVQAIDNSLGASTFSAEGIFEIKNRFNLITYTETPSVSTPVLYLDGDHDGDLDMFLNYPGIFYAAENKLASFSQTDYKTILANGYDPIKTITPNDYDNDNLIDFSVSGNFFGTGSLDSTIVLFGYNGPFNYSIINNSLVKNLDFEYVLWADLNNDGKQDLITSGKTTNLVPTNKPATYIFKNMGNGSFQKAGNYIRGVEKCGAVAGDYDNDRDIDFLVYGKDSLGVANTYMYVNQGDFNFTENLIPNNELYRAYLTYGIQTGDFDLNGELDFYMAGANTQSDFYARVLLNNNMSLSDANLPIRSSPFMSNYWGDYDYDGDIDIFSTSLFTSPDKMRLYLNNNGSLTETVLDLGAVQDLDLPLIAANLDNKNGLDFLMKRNSADYLYYQYFDNWGSNTRLSAAPANTRYEQDKLDIILHWDRVADCPGCTYNIRVGTQTDNVSIMSPMSDLSTGYRYVVQPGNAYLNDSWKLIDLPVGTYYWSVQAVDPANTGGPWAPVTSFTVTQINVEFSYTTVCHNDTTIFNDLSVATNSVVRWEWDFGDGTVSTLQNPQHTYANAGTYTVGLWAWSQTGESAYKAHTVTVKAAPVTEFSATTACQGTLTSVTNNTTTNGLTISNWLWSFGDGLSSTSQAPEPHGYINSGQYTAELWAFASNGCNSSIQKTVNVGANPIVAVTADGQLTFCSGDSVVLTNTLVSSYNYTWQIGGTDITGANQNTYTAKHTGSYTVRVINPTGNCTALSSPVNVVVSQKPDEPVISFSGSTEFCQGDSLVLAVSQNDDLFFRWRLNGGVIGSNSNQHSARAEGNYTVIVTNGNGCFATSTNSVGIIVNNRPVATAISIIGTNKFCEGGKVILTVPSIAVYSYAWKDSIGPIEGETTNSYTARKSGLYHLEISNNAGCSVKTSPVKVNVAQMPLKPVIDQGNYTKGKCLGETPIKLSVEDVIEGYSYKWYKNGAPVSNLSFIEDFLEQGQYYVEASINECKSNSDSLNIYFENAPDKPLIYAKGPTVWYLTSSITDAAAYRWWYNGNLIPGSDSYMYIANQKLGKYNVSISEDKVCFTMSDAITIPTGITGIEDADPFEGVKIYPNPSSGLFTIEMDNMLSGKLMIRIFDQGGREIINSAYEKISGHFSCQFDLRNRAKGLYPVSLNINGVISGKMLIID